MSLYFLRTCALPAHARAREAGCAAILRNGVRCGSVVAAGSEFCVPHRDFAIEYGEEALRRGEHPRRRPPVTLEPLVVETDSVSLVSNGTADPATVRPRLAEAAAEGLDGIRSSLLEAATGATREHWVTFTCPDCAKKQRLPVTVPGVRSHVAAIEVLLREGWGRAPQAEEPASSRMARTVEQARGLSWDQATLVFATHFAGEIVSVASDGDELLRSRLASLSGEERRVLRRTLEELELV
jgi:hypothetical protein